MDFDVFWAGDEDFGVLVDADFVGGPEGFCDFELGEEGVLFSPGSGCSLVFEDDGEDVVAEFSFGVGVQGKAHEVVPILQYPN